MLGVGAGVLAWIAVGAGKPGMRMPGISTAGVLTTGVGAGVGGGAAAGWQVTVGQPFASVPGSQELGGKHGIAKFKGGHQFGVAPSPALRQLYMEQWYIRSTVVI